MEREALLEKALPEAEASPGPSGWRGTFTARRAQAVATSSTRAFFELKTTRHRSWFDLSTWW